MTCHPNTETWLAAEGAGGKCSLPWQLLDWVAQLWPGAQGWCVYEYSPWAEPTTGLLLVVTPGFLLHRFPTLPAMPRLFWPVDLCPPPSWRHTILATHWAPGTASALEATSAEPHLSAWVTTSRRTQGPSRLNSLLFPSPRSSTTLYFPQFQTMCFAPSDQSQRYGVGPGHSQQQWRYLAPAMSSSWAVPFPFPQSLS